GFAPVEKELSKLTVGHDGHFSLPLSIPDDLGGLHTISIKTDGKTVASAFFAIETSIVSMSPKSGPAGTPASIHLKGVGWTDFDNIYVATYDNGYRGYACGFNSQGDVVVNFTRAGSPDRQLIDFDPGIEQGPENGVQLNRVRRLPPAVFWPGAKVPAVRFALAVAPRPDGGGNGLEREAVARRVLRHGTG